MSIDIKKKSKLHTKKHTFAVRAIRISTEFILLRVCTSKDKVTKEIERNNGTELDPANTTREINQVASLKSISEWNPCI